LSSGADGRDAGPWAGIPDIANEDMFYLDEMK
jgi:hypothetical protein